MFSTKNKQKSKQSGFTLIELMLVIAIIGSLAAIAVPKFSVSQEGARTAKVQADLRIIESAIAVYMAENGGSAPADGTIDSDSVLKDYLMSVPTPSTGKVKLNGTGTTELAVNYIINSGRAAVRPKDGTGGPYYVENFY